MKYKMINFRKNVRVDLSDREIHVPQRQKFHEVPLDRPRNVIEPLFTEQNLTVMFGLSGFVSIVFMVVSFIAMNKEWQTVGLFCLFTCLTCVITLIISAYRYDTNWKTFMWLLNSVLWAIYMFKYMNF